MKPIAVAIFLFGSLFAGVSVSAETVMLYTHLVQSADAQAKNSDPSVAVEDGVMDLFFDSGHIIFDPGLEPKAGDPAGGTSETWAAATARTGGARYLLEMELTFPDSTSQSPARISYKFLQLASGRTLSEGSLSPDAAPADTVAKKAYDRCFALGQQVAREVLKDWKQAEL